MLPPLIIKCVVKECRSACVACSAGKSGLTSITEIMRRFALKEGGDEMGATEQSFEAKHLNQGGAAGYIAKYIAKNIDGYALDGQIDHNTGKPLTSHLSPIQQQL